MSELKPCPFCGEQGIHMPVVFATVVHVACSNRGCYMCRSEVPVDEWNSRTIDDGLRAENARLREALKLLAGYVTHSDDCKKGLSRCTADGLVPYGCTCGLDAAKEE